MDYQNDYNNWDADDHDEAAQLGDAAHDRERQLQKLDHHEDTLLPDHLAHDRSPVRTRDIHESRGHYLSLMYSHIQGLLLTDLYRTIASIHHIKNNFLLKNTKNITKITRMDAYDT